ncbi:hypothetical protein [Sporolactobacillus laevolacticus]|uniref:hypothetical protein n=1 Tax=Sporolactobacillus laevolacticus TaxID=33018 RepID=UPI0025B33441|nr:hypothetical protein [Sporolactobacillus laevolacticus]MDN3956211.1 hypothetical protein [Sporolactobacillus laevolacticus]
MKNRLIRGIVISYLLTFAFQIIFTVFRIRLVWYMSFPLLVFFLIVYLFYPKIISTRSKLSIRISDNKRLLVRGLKYFLKYLVILTTPLFLYISIDKFGEKIIENLFCVILIIAVFIDYLKMFNYLRNRLIISQIVRLKVRTIPLENWILDYRANEQVLFFLLRGKTSNNPLTNLKTIKRRILNICSGVDDLKLLEVYFESFEHESIGKKVWNIFIKTGSVLIPLPILYSILRTIFVPNDVLKIISEIKKAQGTSFTNFLLLIMWGTTILTILLATITDIISYTTEQKRRNNYVLRIVRACIQEKNLN